MFGTIYKTKEQYTEKLIGNQTTYKDFICHRIEKNIGFIEKSLFFSKFQMSTIKRILQSEAFSRHISNMKQGYLAHVDYNLEHIFHHKGSYTGVIDFGDAKTAPKGYDLAYFKISNPNYFDYMHAGYIEASGVPSCFYEDPILVFLVGIRILASVFENSQINSREDYRFQAFLHELDVLSHSFN